MSDARRRGMQVIDATWDRTRASEPRLFGRGRELAVDLLAGTSRGRGNVDWTLQTHLYLAAAGVPCDFVRRLPARGYRDQSPDVSRNGCVADAQATSSVCFPTRGPRTPASRALTLRFTSATLGHI